jgi:hypothetical protein
VEISPKETKTLNIFRHTNRPKNNDRARSRATQDLKQVHDELETSTIELIEADRPRSRRTNRTFGPSFALAPATVPAPTRRSRTDRQGISSPFDGSALENWMYGSPDAVLGLGLAKRSF